MSFAEKMDALDLVITALKDHEKKLDEIVARADSTYVMVTLDEKRGTLVTTLPDDFDIDMVVKRLKNFSEEMRAIGVKVKIDATIGSWITNVENIP